MGKDTRAKRPAEKADEVRDSGGLASIRLTRSDDALSCDRRLRLLPQDPVCVGTLSFAEGHLSDFL